MSNHLTSITYKRDLGSLARKAVMLLMADKASDDGSGIWASKQRMADELCVSRQTIITTIKGLVADGLLSEVGVRKCVNGFTVEYRINIDVLNGVKAVPCHTDPSTPLTGQAALPVKDVDPKASSTLTGPVKDVDTNPPEPPLNPPLPKTRARALPDDWAPQPFSEGSQCGAIVASWSEKERMRHLEHFLAHHRKTGAAFVSWQDAWKTWVLNSRKFGGRHDRTDDSDIGLGPTARAANAAFG